MATTGRMRHVDHVGSRVVPTGILAPSRGDSRPVNDHSCMKDHVELVRPMAWMNARSTRIQRPNDTHHATETCVDCRRRSDRNECCGLSRPR